jgi:hypothetical protein
VLGYCEKGIDCEEAHIRECPDFATNGACKNPKCKLPHVIRANRRRDKDNATTTTTIASTKGTTKTDSSSKVPEDENTSAQRSSTDVPQQPVNGVNYTFEGGDEFIPLTFVESEDDEEDEDEEETDDDDNSEEEKVADEESPDNPGPNPGIKVFS